MIIVLGCGCGVQPAYEGDSGAGYDPNSSIYSYTARDIDGWVVPLSRYEGTVLLVVNVASECRFTGQYANLQRLYLRYRDRGFEVLGFPSNDFGRQEPGSDAEIKAFATGRFNVLFPLFSKTSVKGERAHPLFKCLTREENNAFGGPVTWNFTKFLIGRDGRIIARFDSAVDPLDPRVTEAIEAAVSK